MMSSAWHWFIIGGTFSSLLFFSWLLFANRKSSDQKTTGHVWDGIEELDTPLPMWWVGMFIGSIIFSVLYLIYYPGLGNFSGIGGWTSENQLATETAAHDNRFAPLYAELAGLESTEFGQSRKAMQVGRRLFLNNCSTCHGVSGKGGFGFPDLTDQEWIWGGSPDDIKATLLHGRTALMPPWEVVLGENGVTDVAHYVLALAGAEHDAAKAEAGAEQYQTICVACHGAKGEGNQLLGASKLTDDVWLYGDDINQIAFTIRNGREGVMPGHADLLGADKIQILSTYIGELAK